jgi:anthranilate synthase component 1
MNKAFDAPAGPRPSVRAYQRRLELDRDPFEVFCHLHNGGLATGACFFEAERRKTATLVLAPALSLEVRGDEVMVRADLPAARATLATLADRLEGAQLIGDVLTILCPFAQSRGAADAEERERLRAPSCLDVVRALGEALAGPAAPPLLGAFSYDLLDAFETLPPLQGARSTADIALVVPSVLIELRPHACRATVIAYSFSGAVRDPDALGRLDAALLALRQLPASAGAVLAPAAEPAVDEAESDLSDSDYEAVVHRSQELIRDGEVFQIVPSRTFRLPCPDPQAAFAELRRREQAPYRFFMCHPDGVLFGASPEAAFTATDRRLRVTPLAGTRPRGSSTDRDDRLQAELILDDKERAEHMMLVDLARNDVARICRPGSRRVTRLLEVERYARVMHLVSEVEGEIDDDLDGLDGLRTCLHAGTLVGAPKVRAAEHLRRLERQPRGLYGGAVGRLEPSGDVDVAIVIRSAFVREGVAEVRAGAGVVLGSKPAAEAAETRAKASAVLRAIRAANARRSAPGAAP